MPKPTAHQTIMQIEKFTKTFAIPAPAFLPREKPISRKAKPACMKKTRIAPTITHVWLSSSMAVGHGLGQVEGFLLGEGRRGH
jgi:hypothetical protein